MKILQQESENPVEIFSQPKRVKLSALSDQTHAVRREDTAASQPLRAMAPGGTDYLTALPSHVLLDVIRSTKPNPLRLAQLQTVHSSFRRMCQHESLWETFTPQTAPSWRTDQSHYDAFVERVNALPRRQLEQLRDYLAIPEANQEYKYVQFRSISETSGQYDLCRALADHGFRLGENFCESHSHLVNEPTLAPYLGFGGRKTLCHVAPHLYDDKAFMLRAIDQNADCYHLTSERLKKDQGFWKAALAVNGGVYVFLSDEEKTKKPVVLEALKTWHRMNAPYTRIVPCFYPPEWPPLDWAYPDYWAIAPSFRDDLEVQSALLTRGFLNAAYYSYHNPKNGWRHNRSIIEQIVVQRVPLYSGGGVDVFEQASDAMRDDDELALRALRVDSKRIEFVSDRLRADKAWLSRVSAQEIELAKHRRL